MKLRTIRFLKATGRDDVTVVKFAGKVQRIAQVHQLGLSELPGNRGKPIRYEARQLLGISLNDVELIERLLVGNLI